MPLKSFQKAFSLIELMVVIAIIAIVSAISLASLGAVQKNSRDAQRQSDLATIQGILQQYYADKNRYPNELPSLTAGGPITNCSGTTLPCSVSKTYLSSTPKDPDGTAYYYRPYTNTIDSACGLVAGVEVGVCHRYVICVKLENPPTGSSCYSSSYNYQLTQP